MSWTHESIEHSIWRPFQFDTPRLPPHFKAAAVLPELEKVKSHLHKMQ